MKHLIIIISALLSVYLFSNDLIIIVENPDQRIYHWIESENIEILTKHKDHKLQILVNNKQLSFLENNRYEIEIISTETDWIRDIEGYRNYEDVAAELQQIAADHPEITQLTSLGNSTCYDYYLSGNDNYIDFQHQIWCLKLSDEPMLNEDEPNIFFAAEIHAREPISLEVDMHILNYLITNYGVIDSVTSWIDNNQIWFIPLMNPDGHKLVTEGWHSMHRKNMRDNNENEVPDHSTADGVDLNRNFGYVWGDNGASNNPNSSTYHGPYEWSEQEAVFLRELIYDHKFWGGITYHSAGEYVLYPLGHLPGACSYDHEIMDDLAVLMAENIPKISGTGHYNPLQAVDFGYTCQGTMGDWGYAEMRLFSYTIELATSFIPPASQVEQICEDNLHAALIMLDRINHSTVTGLISNETGEPLVAEIIVSEIDSLEGMSSVEPVRSDQDFGRYYRLLLPGNYTFTFRNEHYPDVRQENVEVFADSATNLNITFRTEFVDAELITITTGGHYVYLEWDFEEGYGFEIYSSFNPFTDFEINENGEFAFGVTSRNIWFEQIDSHQKYYIVKRILL